MSFCPASRLSGNSRLAARLATASEPAAQAAEATANVVEIASTSPQHDGGPEWERVKITAHDVPRIDRDWLEAERNRIGDWWWRQEYMCEFVETEDRVFHYADIMRAGRKDIEPLFPLPGVAA